MHPAQHCFSGSGFGEWWAQPSFAISVFILAQQLIFSKERRADWAGMIANAIEKEVSPQTRSRRIARICDPRLQLSARRFNLPGASRAARDLALRRQSA
jgi:hypothetical protein